MARQLTVKQVTADELALVIGRLSDTVRPSRLTASALGTITDKLTGAEVNLLLDLVQGLRAQASVSHRGGRYWRTWALELQTAAVALLKSRPELREATRRGKAPGPMAPINLLREAAVEPSARKAPAPTFQRDRHAGRSLEAEEAVTDVEPANGWGETEGGAEPPRHRLPPWPITKPADADPLAGRGAAELIAKVPPRRKARRLDR